MELRNPMEGIGLGWSITGYARCRVVRTPPPRFVPAYRAVETKTRPCHLKMILMGLQMASASIWYLLFQKKNVHDFSMVVLLKASPNPAVVCSLSSPVAARPGRFCGSWHPARHRRKAWSSPGSPRGACRKAPQGEPAEIIHTYIVYTYIHYTYIPYTTIHTYTYTLITYTYTYTLTHTHTITRNLSNHIII